MPKAYWVTMYRSISNPDALQAYSKLAAPAIQAGGGRFLARGNPSNAFESGTLQRTVLIEFESLEQAVKTYGSDAYKEALRALGDGADRDIRFIEGVS